MKNEDEWENITTLKVRALSECLLNDFSLLPHGVCCMLNQFTALVQEALEFEAFCLCGDLV